MEYMIVCDTESLKIDNKQNLNNKINYIRKRRFVFVFVFKEGICFTKSWAMGYYWKNHQTS